MQEDDLTTPDYFLNYTVPNPAVEARTLLSKRLRVSGLLQVDVASATAGDSFVLYVWVDPFADDSSIQTYVATPTVTVYTPTTTAYLKVTPTSTSSKTVIRARTVTDTLAYATAVTHLIADATTIAAADADDLAKSKTLIDEIMPETNVHFASEVYHTAADAVWYGGHKEDDATNLASSDNMSDLATGYVLADELDDDVIAHLASTTFHAAADTVYDFGGTPNSEGTLVTKVNLLRTAMAAHFASTACHSVADSINVALVAATTIATNTASAQTLINLLKAYWNSHCAVGDATAADLAAVIVGANAARAALLAHYANSTIHSGTADAANLATLTAVPACTDAATSYTLLNAEKATVNLHYLTAAYGAAYGTVAAGYPLEWPSTAPVFVKTSSSGGTFTTTEFI